ncbi:hypothetical protein Hanom_Chr06g00541581 [Helianthus anomalus]
MMFDSGACKLFLFSPTVDNGLLCFLIFTNSDLLYVCRTKHKVYRGSLRFIGN